MPTPQQRVQIYGPPLLIQRTILAAGHSSSARILVQQEAQTTILSQCEKLAIVWAKPTPCEFPFLLIVLTNPPRPPSPLPFINRVQRLAQTWPIRIRRGFCRIQSNQIDGAPWAKNLVFVRFPSDSTKTADCFFSSQAQDFLHIHHYTHAQELELQYDRWDVASVSSMDFYSR